MKKPFFLFVLFVCLALLLPAQAVLQDVRFVPPVFYVGDPVEMHIDFLLDAPMAVEVPQVMPESDWVDIHDIQIDSDSGRLSLVISFTPFAPGTRTLPAMELGSLQLRDIKIPTHSLISGETEGVRVLRGQLLLPGTRLALSFFLALAAMAPFIGFGLVRFTVRQIKRLRDAWQVGKPARRLQKVLKMLKTRTGTEPASQWYAELTEELRDYLSAKTGHDCRSATTAEIGRMKEFQSSEGPGFVLLNVLKDGDMVKFAGQYADQRILNRSAETVALAVQEWEKKHERIQ
ncbi:MAG: hypothetical protein CSA76_01140 [Spirochaetales bacterium]|nr:MAG: hypothetical protein CSA76_01140 [Spirochaetales bacterium]